MQQCVMSGWQVAEMSILGPASGWAAWSKCNSWATCLLWGLPVYRYVQFSSVAQSCPTLSNPMDCSMSGFPVHHQLPELAQTHVHWVSNAILSPVILFSSCHQSFPTSGSFQMSQFFASGGQSIGASASASVLPMNIQDWFPQDWLDLLEFKGLSRVFSNTQFNNINSSELSFLHSPSLTSIHDCWKNHSFD